MSFPPPQSIDYQNDNKGALSSEQLWCQEKPQVFWQCLKTRHRVFASLCLTAGFSASTQAHMPICIWIHMCAPCCNEYSLSASEMKRQGCRGNIQEEKTSALKREKCWELQCQRRNLGWTCSSGVTKLTQCREKPAAQTAVGNCTEAWNPSPALGKC